MLSFRENYSLSKVFGFPVFSLDKTLMLGKIEGRGRRGQQRMRWLDGIDGHEFEQALGVGDGQRCLLCCSPWGCKESDTTEQLNWSKVFFVITSWKRNRKYQYTSPGLNLLINEAGLPLLILLKVNYWLCSQVFLQACYVKPFLNLSYEALLWLILFCCSPGW